MTHLEPVANVFPVMCDALVPFQQHTVLIHETRV
jgi:hypothetical protein